MIKKLLNIVYFIIIVFLINSCRIYSFTGASIPAGAKTVSVEYFKNVAQVFNPTLSQQFTEMLQNKLVSKTSLSLTNGKGDLQFKGQIVGYTVTPVAMVANETAAMNRLTIQVKVDFTNEIEKTYNFSQTFSRYADFDSKEILSTVEPNIVPDILEQLTDDIFQKAVVNW
jgi:hypothetical protein